jgi:hypothetical protein
MNKQGYANHGRYITGFHVVLASLLVFGTISSVVNLYQQWTAHYDMTEPVLIAVLFICGLLLFWYSRRFAVTVQDRAIRAEENLRYFILKSKPLDSRITMAQVIALRFAPDDEFVVLAERAAKENLSKDEIKKAIKDWKADHHRA